MGMRFGVRFNHNLRVYTNSLTVYLNITMSILFTSNVGFLIDHEVFIRSNYQNFRFKEVFFDIRTKFRKDLEAQKFASELESPPEQTLSRRKRKKPALEHTDQDWLHVKNKFEDMITEIKANGLLDYRVTISDIRGNNGNARKAVSEFLSATGAFNIQEKTFDSENCHMSACKRRFLNETFVLPADCKFYNRDVEYLGILSTGNKYSLIVIDPPWTNKHVKRRKKSDEHTAYRSMENEDLLTMPVGELCEEGALVAIWCTNSQKHLRYLKEVLIPTWGLCFVAEWYWVKVTKSGESVTDWNISNGKQPYERILLARKNNPSSPPLPNPENGKLVISVPSAVHSFKPPLIDVLKPYVKCDPSYLEVFARSLVPGGTSIGNQVILLQHSSLFEKICSITNTD